MWIIFSTECSSDETSVLYLGDTTFAVRLDCCDMCMNLNLDEIVFHVHFKQASALPKKNELKAMGKSAEKAPGADFVHSFL
jgi:hypothetical protein